jgi:hypothetical protein
LVSAVLLLLGVVPGLVYMVVRWFKGGAPECARCGSRSLVRPPDSLLKRVVLGVLVVALVVGVAWFWWYLLTQAEWVEPGARSRRRVVP